MLLDPASGAWLVALLALYVVTALAVVVARIWPGAGRRQRWLLVALPIVFVPFLATFPAVFLTGLIAINVIALVRAAPRRPR